jgi:glutamyl-tRNA synthetase
MTVLVRFAPSPTGNLHVGNARTALVNFLLADAKPDNFILRYDDTDQERSRHVYVESIARDLSWMGISWREEVFQSQRLDLYQAAAEKLKDAGRLYACYETAEELEFMRRRRRARNLPPIYDRSALELTDADRAKYEAEGRRPHWRFKLDHDNEIRWNDLVRGECHYAGQHLSDPVLIRGDGTFLYMLPSTVDDADMGITHVVRGEDHVTNTAVQIQLFRALGHETPSFAHLPLLIGSEGESLSKRLGSLGIGDLRDQGLEPMALNSLLGRLGTSDAIEPVRSLEDLRGNFDMSHFGRGTPRFDQQDLMRLNQKLVHDMPWDEAAPRLKELGCEQAGPEFWDAVRGNLTVLPDVREWYEVVYGTVEPVIDDQDFAAKALDLLPPEPWDQETWKAWTGAVKDATGRKGKELFMPLRKALTARDHGPELKALLPLIGREKAAARLSGGRA